ncbi:20354_t:CDS:2, partial [Gigaspora margarita]
SNGWNTDMTDELQESNSQVLQTINESDDSWNTDITDEFQGSDLLTVKYQLEFEEYPETAPDGVACIYNIAGMDPEKVYKIFDLKNIQYSYKDGTTCDNVHCSFLNTKVYKETRLCHRVKFCQFISPELKNNSYTVVDFDDELFKKIFEANELLVDTATLNEFVAAYKISCEYYDELAQIRCNGKPNLAKHY